jgi:hypothetical protein
MSIDLSTYVIYGVHLGAGTEDSDNLFIKQLRDEGREYEDINDSFSERKIPYQIQAVHYHDSVNYFLCYREHIWRTYDGDPLDLLEVLKRIDPIDLNVINLELKYRCEEIGVQYQDPKLYAVSQYF